MENKFNLNETPKTLNSKEEERLAEITPLIKKLKDEKKKLKNRTSRDQKEEEISELEDEKKKLLAKLKEQEKEPIKTEEVSIPQNQEIEENKKGIEKELAKEDDREDQKKQDATETAVLNEFRENFSKPKKVINLEEVRAKRKEGEVENNENILNEELLKDIANKSVHSLLSDKEREIFDKNEEKINKIIEEMKGAQIENEKNEQPLENQEKNVNKEEVEKQEKIKILEEGIETKKQQLGELLKLIDILEKQIKELPNEEKIDEEKKKKLIKELEDQLRKAENEKNGEEYEKIEKEIKKLKGEEDKKEKDILEQQEAKEAQQPIIETKEKQPFSFNAEFIKNKIPEILKSIEEIKEIDELSISGSKEVIVLNAKIKAKYGVNLNITLTNFRIINNKSGITLDKENFDVKTNVLGTAWGVKKLIISNIDALSEKIKETIGKEVKQKIEKVWIENGELKAL